MKKETQKEMLLKKDEKLKKKKIKKKSVAEASFAHEKLMFALLFPGCCTAWAVERFVVIVKAAGLCRVIDAERRQRKAEIEN